MPAIDLFAGRSSSFDAPASRAEAVTPHDSNELTRISRGLWVGGTGDVTVEMVGAGDTVTIASVPAGTMLALRVRKVKATGTTATDIVAFC